ncbi:hypothetical protein T492DRAFT_1069226 [Pavlovales sp. CCMP2436]|nr:hypothetical protein T492DRAFT_1069226 [Pavlovales sp. CCMP2436]
MRPWTRPEYWGFEFRLYFNLLMSDTQRARVCNELVADVREFCEEDGIECEDPPIASASDADFMTWGTRMRWRSYGGNEEGWVRYNQPLNLAEYRPNVNFGHREYFAWRMSDMRRARECDELVADVRAFCKVRSIKCQDPPTADASDADFKTWGSHMCWRYNGGTEEDWVQCIKAEKSEKGARAAYTARQVARMEAQEEARYGCKSDPVWGAPGLEK